MEPTNDYAIYIIAGVVALAAIVGVCFFIKRRQKKENTVRPNTVTEDKKEEIVDKKEEIKVEKTLSASLLIPFVKSLGSSVGGLFQIAKDGDKADTASLLFDNLDLTFTYIDSDELKNQWKSFTDDRKNWDEKLYRDKSASLLNTLYEAGVVIPEQDNLIWDEVASRRYRSFGEIHEGDKCIVLSPYALFDGLLLTDGLVKKCE